MSAEPARATDLQDERLIHYNGIGGAVREFVSRVRGGDLGSLPVIAALAVIWIVFQIINPNFLSSANLVNLTMQCAAVGTISIGIVLVLLLGEIDLSVGSVSGLAAAILAVGSLNLTVELAAPWWIHLLVQAGVIIVAILGGALVGFAYGLLYTRFGVPSFVITLAGLLAILGLQLFLLGGDGSIVLSDKLGIVYFAQQLFLPEWAAYFVVVLAIGALTFGQHLQSTRRRDAGLSFISPGTIWVRNGALLVSLLLVSWILYRNFGPSAVQGRGVGVMFLFFVLLVVVMNLVLTRTGWGRAVYAVGGNVEAARRAGIRVRRIYISVFILCSTFAAVGGLLAAARGLSANQSSGGGDTNLNAIAAAVIGGTSLFGGRGSAYSALLGIIVIMSISSGLTLMSLNSSVRFMITGAVLLLAVIIDSISRRSRAAAGLA
jgi:simple sugar transport system permease protein/D-xylose transport system permease protein